MMSNKRTLNDFWNHVPKGPIASTSSVPNTGVSTTAKENVIGHANKKLKMTNIQIPSFPPITVSTGI